MSRDRDPFERTLEAIRHKLRAGEGLQGGPIAINLLAQALGVSPTPVREALAWLAGEGLVRRTHAGYVGQGWDRTSLTERYGLALLHVTAALSITRPLGRLRLAVPAPIPVQAQVQVEAAARSPDPHVLIDRLAAQAGHRALLASLRRTRAPLQVFIPAEETVIGDQAETLAALEAASDDSRARPIVRAFYQRRIRAADMILRTTLDRLEL